MCKRLLYAGHLASREYDVLFLQHLRQKWHVYAATFTPHEKVVRVEGVTYLELHTPNFPLIMTVFPLSLIASILSNIFRALALALCIMKVKPEVVNAHWATEYAFYCALVKLRPLVVTIWGTDVLIYPKRSKMDRLKVKFALKMADRIIVDSQVQLRAVQEFGALPSKVVTFPWGIDLQKFNPSCKVDGLKERLGLREGDQIVLSLRYLYPIYGLECLIDIASIVCTKHLFVKFVIIGDGPLMKELKERVRKLGIERSVIFTGYVPHDEISYFINLSDVYVSTSFSDGTSCSLLEAMACGKPVVVTDIPGNREWVKDGKNGFLVPMANPKAFAQRILMLLRDDGLRESFSKENIAIAKARADWQKNSQMLDKALTFKSDQSR